MVWSEVEKCSQSDLDLPQPTLRLIYIKGRLSFWQTYQELHIFVTIGANVTDSSLFDRKLLASNVHYLQFIFIYTMFT